MLQPRATIPGVQFAGSWREGLCFASPRVRPKVLSCAIARLTNCPSVFFQVFARCKAMFPNGTGSLKQPGHPVGSCTPDAKPLRPVRYNPPQYIEMSEDAYGRMKGS